MTIDIREDAAKLRVDPLQLVELFLDNCQLADLYKDWIAFVWASDASGSVPVADTAQQPSESVSKPQEANIALEDFFNRDMHRSEIARWQELSHSEDFDDETQSLLIGIPLSPDFIKTASQVLDTPAMFKSLDGSDVVWSGKATLQNGETLAVQLFKTITGAWVDISMVLEKDYQYPDPDYFPIRTSAGLFEQRIRLEAKDGRKWLIGFYAENTPPWEDKQERLENDGN